MNQSEKSAPEPPEVSQVVEHLFRHEAGKIVATLTHIFGIEHLTLAEDVLQEALARALQTWPFHGIPQNPPAWIMRTARNLALDVVRRQKVFREKEPEIIRLLEGTETMSDPSGDSEREIADDRLRMMFVCCHPQIPPADQVALALKILCGFSVAEIGRAFLTTDMAIARRLTRAKQKIREAGVAFEIPGSAELARRRGGVLQSLYLLFNEGYKASGGDKLVREDICSEAIRLTSLLAGHPAGNDPETHALLALMLLNTARLPARMDNQGNLLRLREQDRALWSQPLMARGMFHLAKSAVGDQITVCHLEAAIAACHCTAEDYESTNWRQILSLYDRLVEIDDSPVGWLNRAVALAEVQGPQAALEALQDLPNQRALAGYYLLPAVLGEFEWRLNRPAAAAAHFQKARQLAEIKSEQIFLEKRLQDCRQLLALENSI